MFNTKNKKETKGSLILEIETMKTIQSKKSPYRLVDVEMGSKDGSDKSKASLQKVSTQLDTELTSNVESSPFLDEKSINGGISEPLPQMKGAIFNDQKPSTPNTAIPNNIIEPDALADISEEYESSELPTSQDTEFLADRKIEAKESPIFKDQNVYNIEASPETVEKITPSKPKKIKDTSGFFDHGVIGSEENTTKEQTTIQTNSAINIPLLIIAIIVFLLTIAAGIYYYKTVVSADQIQEPITIEPIDENLTDPISQPEGTTEQTPENENIIETSEQITITSHSFSSTTFVQDIKDYIDELLADSANFASLSRGFLVQPLTTDQKPFTPATLLKALDMSIPTANSFFRDEAWIFFVLESPTDNASNKLITKISIALQVDPISKTTNKNIVSEITALETQLPDKLATLFISESVPTQSNTSGFTPSLLQYPELQSARYYNYKSGNTKQSVDWGLLKNNDENYLYFGTSLFSTQKMIEALLQNDKNVDELLITE